MSATSEDRDSLWFKPLTVRGFTTGVTIALAVAVALVAVLAKAGGLQ